ncbi:hypothetical protein AB0P17_29670 [Streptomyces sp. NPDC088124]|uniref:hypothetical protein n=1 Tax=Streptomyces sp. NPDC088124 TaxID=3154654 RepID=UPI0034130F7B
MADCIHYGDIVRLAGRRGIVDRNRSRYPARPDVHLILGFRSEGGGYAWAEAKDVEKLSTVFLGMPNKEHAPEYLEPLTLWQQIPHEYDEYLTWDMDANCMYCGASEKDPIHTDSD